MVQCGCEPRQVTRSGTSTKVARAIFREENVPVLDA
jgi:hypothetical protein